MGLNVKWAVFHKNTDVTLRLRLRLATYGTSVKLTSVWNDPTCNVLIYKLILHQSSVANLYVDKTLEYMLYIVLRF